MDQTTGTIARNIKILHIFLSQKHTANAHCSILITVIFHFQYFRPSYFLDYYINHLHINYCIKKNNSIIIILIFNINFNSIKILKICQQHNMHDNMPTVKKYKYNILNIIYSSILSIISHLPL